MLLPRMLFLALGLTAAGAAAQGPVERWKRPNLVLFLVDDLGWQDSSVAFTPEPTAFNRRYRTPHLERLAAEGLRFTQGYASAPVCSPTRTSIQTGMSPARSRITYWTLHKDKDQSAGYPRVKAPAWNVNALQEGDVTLPALLRAAGYRTIHAGKAHLGAKDTSGADPTRLGFDVNIAGHAPGGPGSFYGLHDFRAKGRQGQAGTSVWDVPGLEDYHGHDIYLTEALALEACRAVRAAVADEAPFFLHFAPYAVHAPIMGNAKYEGHYPDLHPIERRYASMVETVDHALGALLTTLERAGELDNTLFIYTSDNGGLSAHGRDGKHVHNAPLRSGKGSSYEGGVRVPWVVRWPGVVAPGTSSDVPVISHDLFPTLLAAAHVAIPAEHAPHVDGVDLSVLLRGGELEPRPLVWHMPHFWGVRGPGIEPYSAVRAAQWKLLYFHGDERFELYDLSKDLGETQDRSAEQPDVVSLLATVLSNELEERGAQMSVVIETGEPVHLPHLVTDQR